MGVGREVQILSDGLRKRGVGRSHLDARLDHERLSGRGYMEDVLAYAGRLEWCMRRGIGLILQGPYGSGKTSLAVCLMREAFRIGADVHMVMAADLQRIIIDKPDWEEEEPLDQRILRVPFLVVDNMNDELAGKWQSQTFEGLIRHRWNEMRSTIITTNIRVQDLRNVVSPGCCQLLQDRCVPVVVDGPPEGWRKKMDSGMLRGDER